jgi:hypothetical protein
MNPFPGRVERRGAGIEDRTFDGVQNGLEQDELHQLRRAWDGARSAHNAVESLVMVQEPAPSTDAD